MLRPSRLANSLKTGLKATFEVLTKTHNEAAVDLLLSKLDSPYPAVREGALECLLKRRTVAGHNEIICRLGKLDARAREIVGTHQRFLGRALRDCILSTNPQAFAAGSSAVMEFRDYDMLPTLVHAAEDEAHPFRKTAAQHSLQLAEFLYEDLAAKRSTQAGRDPQLTRKHMLHTLEQSLARYPQHKQSEVIEAFLILVPRDYPAFQKILGDPMDVAYLAITDLLTHSLRPGVIRLVLSFLDDPQAPSSVVKLLGRRCDAKFLEHFLHKIGSQPSAAAMQNLRRIDTIGWLEQKAIVDKLDEAAQYGAVQLVQASSINKAAKFLLIEHLLRFGRPAGRRAAAVALAGYHGAEANQLAHEAVQDPDPQVQAHVLVQLRSRGIPGALALLLAMLDSPHEVIRGAARRSLDEFSFDRFLAAFDSLDDHVRRTTGPTVRKVDPVAVRRLHDEFDARSRTRRMRAVGMAMAMQVVPQFEAELIGRLADEDHMVRAEAAKALAQCSTENARRALEAAKRDRSIVVQEAAAQSLHNWGFDDIASQVLAGDAAAVRQGKVAAARTLQPETD